MTMKGFVGPNLLTHLTALVGVHTPCTHYNVTSPSNTFSLQKVQYFIYIKNIITINAHIMLKFDTMPCLLTHNPNIVRDHHISRHNHHEVR